MNRLRDGWVLPVLVGVVAFVAVRLAMLPGLEGAEPVSAYAGLRPAGRGVNYVIGPSPTCPQLVNVAAIRSTGLSASLGIGGYVADLLAHQGVAA